MENVLSKTELIEKIGEVVSQLDRLMSSLDDYQVNRIPYEKSWTAGQLVRHVTKSIDAMSKALNSKSEPADRDPAQRIEELKEIFLDFSTKLKSPDFIVPENGPYDKITSRQELKRSFESLEENIANAQPDDLVKNLPMGPITKLEIGHFVLFHTQRHLHQMKKICTALEKHAEA